ncbi:MAG: type II secretion system F family protein [Nanoarchaeota archaeon]|nr:type II secretion system F family protein [Nanoarchaeota archaeon]
MSIQKEGMFEELKNNILKEKQLSKELDSMFIYYEQVKEAREKRLVKTQFDLLRNSLKKANEFVLIELKKINLARPLEGKFERNKLFEKSLKDVSELDEATLKRLKKSEEEKSIPIKKKKASKYVQRASKKFGKRVKKMLDQKMFATLERDLIQANLQFPPIAYISTIFYSTLISIFIAIFLFVFFLFFNFGPALPFITKATESVGLRFFKVFWILFLIPIGTYLFMYFYPSMEKKSIGTKIDRELPFATINMAAISGSMIDPTKIFSIIISTKEYPALEKEFTKLMNEINIYGYDLVTALKKVSMNGPSKKLSELLNGLSTTISSGGDLPQFFDKRAETLLFEHRIEKEKETKSAETFMDIYISVVIAAPMIIMLLLMMMKMSGLGISLSTSMITLIAVLAVTGINIAFMTFLHLKQAGE